MSAPSFTPTEHTHRSGRHPSRTVWTPGTYAEYIDATDRERRIATEAARIIRRWRRWHESKGGPGRDHWTETSGQGHVDEALSDAGWKRRYYVGKLALIVSMNMQSR